MGVKPSVSPARAAAFDVLFALESPGSPPLDELICTPLERTVLAAADRGLFFQIAQGVVRHRTFLDSTLTPFLRTGLERVPRPVRIALRMGAFQHLFLERVPRHALVNETVELVRAAGFSRKMCGFSNAVMRRVAELDKGAILALPDDAPRDSIVRRFSVPEWIAREIEAAYGAKSLRAECEALAQPAPVDLRLNTLKGDLDLLSRRLAEELATGAPQSVGSVPGSPPSEDQRRKTLPGEGQAPETLLRGPVTRSQENGQEEASRKSKITGASDREAVPFVPGRFSPDALRLSVGLDVTQLSAFRDGLVTLQDEAAQVISYFLDVRPSQRVADFCAAPGGKTSHLAAILQNQGELWALDADPDRLDSVRATCARLGATCVRFALNTPDVRVRWTSSPADALDAALVDPPCTNLGTIRRHPDVKWRHRATDPARMAKKQLKILSQAAECVRPGGVLVYSVCTFTRAETVEVVDAFLRTHPRWQRDLSFAPPPFIPPFWRSPSGDYLTQTSRDLLDAFFLSRLRYRP